MFEKIFKEQKAKFWPFNSYPQIVYVSYIFNIFGASRCRKKHSLTHSCPALRTGQNEKKCRQARSSEISRFQKNEKQTKRYEYLVIFTGRTINKGPRYMTKTIKSLKMIERTLEKFPKFDWFFVQKKNQTWRWVEFYQIQRNDAIVW